jgi:hypothetical protein
MLNKRDVKTKDGNLPIAARFAFYI